MNQADRPLALYWFGNDGGNRQRILRETVAGGVTINDCMLHLVQENQPFGGVGASGMGAYHGEWGFRTFSKEKPVFLQSRLSAGAPAASALRQDVRAAFRPAPAYHLTDVAASMPK